MQLLARRIEKQFKRNHQQHAFAEELVVKIQRMRECLTGDTLPLPTADVIATWDDLPNDTINILPMSMKTGLVFLRAPPPTPAEIRFDFGATSTDLSPNDNNNDGWVYANNTNPTPVVAASRALGGSTASNDPKSRGNHLDQRSDIQSTVEESSQSTDSDSASSDPESFSWGSGTMSTPVGFYNLVNQWFMNYRIRGMDPFVDSLIAFGVISLGTATLAPRIACAVIKIVKKISYKEGKVLGDAIRFSALIAFRKSWEPNNTWMGVSSTPHGINYASFIGSLFDAKMSDARDVHLCLSFLSEGEKRFDRLCAMHALLVQANDKLCKKRNLPDMMQFRERITSRDGVSGKYVWTTCPHSEVILTDILAMIERWMALQALKRDRSRTPSGNHTIRNRAVGPRLRGNGPGPVAVEPLGL